MKTNNSRLMKSNKIIHHLAMVLITILVTSCVPELSIQQANTKVPEIFSGNGGKDTISQPNWRDYFQDDYLNALIDTALQNNQELKIFLQEVEMVKNEVRARKGEYLPFVDFGASAEIEKVGEFTRAGAVERQLELRDGEAFPEPLPNYVAGAYANWEIDVWKKLRNAKKAALTRYMASVEGRNFMVTNLVAEIANSYYELLALDNQLSIVQQNVNIQKNALEIVKVQKLSTKVTELAVKRFEAQLSGTQSLQYEIQQQIVVVENRINFLLGRYPQPLLRPSDGFHKVTIDSIQTGIPSQLLTNRPDIRQAELELEAAKVDVKVAKVNFYPSFGIRAGLGFQSFNPKYLLETPASLLYSFGGEVMGPLVNRNAIKAFYYTANARQIQALVAYEQTILNAYIEVANQLANIENMRNSFELKEHQVEVLNESIEIAGTLFKSARADYVEVLLTQEEALESRFELTETRLSQLHAMVNIYRALGGGWN